MHRRFNHQRNRHLASWALELTLHLPVFSTEWEVANRVLESCDERLRAWTLRRCQKGQLSRSFAGQYPQTLTQADRLRRKSAEHRARLSPAL